MAPKMKAAAAKAMPKGEIAQSLADACELKKKEASKMLTSLAEIATEQVKSAGKFVIPGLCTLKTRQKAATKAGKREMFGKVVIVKAKPAKTVVKAFPAKVVKDQF